MWQIPLLQLSLHSPTNRHGVLSLISLVPAACRNVCEIVIFCIKIMYEDFIWWRNLKDLTRGWQLRFFYKFFELFLLNLELIKN